MAHALKKLLLYQNHVKKATQFGLPRLIHETDSLNGLKNKFVAPTRMEQKKRADYMKEKGIFPVIKRSQFTDWNYDAEIYAFGRRLGEQFDETLIREALTDISYITEEIEKLKKLAVENPSLDLKSNKDLSHAGISLIGDFCTKYLRYTWPLLPEEGIGSVVDHLTSIEVLGKIGRGFGMKDLILTKEYPPSESTYAESFSAVVAALNATSGLERTQKFILDFVLTDLIGKDIWDIWKVDDPINLLKGILSRSGRGLPEPRIIGELGKGTLESVFEIGIYSDKNLIGKGYGESIDMAVDVAAFDSLSRLFEQTLRREPMQFDVLPDSFGLLTEPNPTIKEWTLDKFHK